MSEYVRWASHHICAFGITDSGIETVLAWEGAFTKLFSIEELYAATEELLLGTAAGRFASEHRALIIAAIETAKNKRRRKDEPSYSCRSCSGSGWVSVPHPGLDENGQRFAYLRSPREDLRGLTRTMGVCCTDCNKGQRTRFDSEARGKPAMTFAEYLEYYPDWEMVQAEREAVIRSEFEPSTVVDLAAFRAEIANRFRTPKETTTSRRN